MVTETSHGSFIGDSAEVEALSHTRAQNIERIQWEESSKGPATSRLYVQGFPDQYTDQELQSLADFSDRSTKDYLAHWVDFRGCNFQMIRKMPPSWYRAKISWTKGSMFSTTLEDALRVLDDSRRPV